MKRFTHLGRWCSRRAAVLVLLLAPLVAQAQLISPGKLSAAHADLEGLTKCTSCHVLGQPGAANAKCLTCHTPLATRIAARQGFHAGVASETCASCHKEHFGRDFDMVRFDADRFDHRNAGFVLEGRHARLTCQSCHTSARITAPDVKAFANRHRTTLADTYLGLSTTCQGCHAAENPHGAQFAGQTCQTCHTQETWTGATHFDHARTRFPLVGLHRQVTCDGCHRADPAHPGSARFAGTPFTSCQTCHDDPHRGTRGATCTTCHTPAGWQQIDRKAFEGGFDHAQTGFALVGRHAALACASCHAKPGRRTDAIAITFQRGTDGAAYPHPVATTCASCHRDYHAGAFVGLEGGGTCESCHGPDGWTPTTFDLARHNRETAFALTGAHLATPCTACHHSAALDQTRLTFAFASTTCTTCHASDSPHGAQFAGADGTTTCQTCHTTEAWTPVVGFDHAQTNFPLAGAHARTACADCHTTGADGVRTFRGLSTQCATCHADPHRGQFAGETCATCHDTASFHLASFDHTRTRFPLAGAHEAVACASCHRPEQAPDGAFFTRFKPLGTACTDCHTQPR